MEEGNPQDRRHAAKRIVTAARKRGLQPFFIGMQRVKVCPPDIVSAIFQINSYMRSLYMLSDNPVFPAKGSKVVRQGEPDFFD